MRHIFRTLALMALATSMICPVGAQETTNPQTALEAIRLEARRDSAQAAHKLRAMNPSLMSDVDRQTWLRLARTAAVRTGDRDWLVSLSQHHDPFSPVHVNRVLLASGHLSEGQFQAAQAELSRIDDLSKVNTRDQRRYWSIKARLGQMEGNLQAERVAVEKIMQELPHWPTKACQACHDDPNQKEVLPLLDVRNFWFAKRYVELMRLQGDAESVKQAASHKLAANPGDDEARLFLAHALQALGQHTESERLLQAIPWVTSPDRRGPSPRMMFAWP